MEERESPSPALCLIGKDCQVPGKEKYNKGHSFSPQGLQKKGDRGERSWSGHSVLFLSFLNTNWLQKYPDMYGRARNTGLLAHIPEDIRGRLQGKDKLITTFSTE